MDDLIPSREMVERFMADPERCMPSERAALEAKGYKASAPAPRKHEWGPSRVGHGEAQCVRCQMTNREAWVLGEFCV